MASAAEGVRVRGLRARVVGAMCACERDVGVGGRCVDVGWGGPGEDKRGLRGGTTGGGVVETDEGGAALRVGGRGGEGREGKGGRGTRGGRACGVLHVSVWC